MSRVYKLLLSLGVGILFLAFGIADLPNYGPNWDEPVHFGRGQAILHYFLTGKKNYNELSPRQAIRRSYYQHDGYTYAFFEEKFSETKKFLAGTGHPVLSDIFAAVANRVFYQALNAVGDIESYHLYGVATAAILTGVVFFVTSSLYGLFVGFVSVLSLMLSPLFLGESRFNIKDVPEAVFYACTILTFYQGIVKNNWKWIVLSSFFAGLAFSTKLNIVFAGVTAGIWVLIVYLDIIRSKGWKKFFVSRTLVLLSFLCYPIVSLILYFGSWPILWKDPINRFFYNLNYYKTIGTVGPIFAEFTTVFGVSTYTLQWILFSTPLVVLIFTSFGFFAAIRTAKKNTFFPLLVLLWFLIPIVRVSLPGLVIYGGARQIMEYIPAMAILAGIGANAIYTHYKGYNHYNRYIKAAILLSFLPITFKIISMHPNESIYFNPLIGGLKGAAARNIPGWGNSLGSTYRQGVKWINENAEPRAKLGFLYELRSNIPQIDLRPDIEFSNQVRSAIQRKGEYIIGVTHDATQEYSYHRKYLERFLEPVYTVSVEGVSVLKIWKNDMEHSKPAYQKQEEIVKIANVFQKDGNTIVDLGQIQRITRLFVQYPVSASCTPPTNGYFQYSLDGTHWDRETADFSFFPLASWFKTQPAPGVLQFLFAAEPARFIKLVILDNNSCLMLQPLRVQVSIL